MGLDMYMQGHAFFIGDRKTIDDFPIKEIVVELGYWRKHPNLHGAIVQAFADGKDNCEPIEMGKESLLQLKNMIETDQLPPTSGFFFGQSPTQEDKEEYEKRKQKDIIIVGNALKWNSTANENEIRWVTYRADW